jgi:type II secretory pathway pseudopilin PulG
MIFARGRVFDDSNRIQLSGPPFKLQMLIGSISRRPPASSHKGEQGYFLLLLMLTVTLMIIAAAVAAPTIAFEIKRDRELEMIHRGVQYSRAIRNYYKKFGRYPTRLEDLDNTNNLRYLRKHYKDPINKNQDFKLLHYGDPGVTMGMSFGGGAIQGANTVGQMNAAQAGSAFGSSSGGFGGSSGSLFSQSSGFGGNSSSFGQSSSGFGGNSSSFGGSSGSFFGGNSNSGFGNNSNGSSTSGTSANGAPGSTGAGSNSGSDATEASTQGAAGTTQAGSGSDNQKTFGGGPIVGVASGSKEKTIREYNKKKKYNEWQFVYDPTLDRGGLILTPYQPGLQISNAMQNGQPGSTNGNSSGQSSAFGSSSSFGGSSSFGSSSSFGGNSGFGNSGVGNSGFGNGSSSSTPSPPPSNSPQ